MKRIMALIIAAALTYFISAGLSDGIGESHNENTVPAAGMRFNSREVNGPSDKAVQYGGSGYEASSANTVTEIVVNYRSLDTLGEVSVLFLAATGVLTLLGGKKKRVLFKKPNFILDVSSRFIAPLMMLFGVYVFTHGHLTPGGGFQGGAIIAVSVLLLYMSHNGYNAPSRGLKLLEGLAGLGYVAIGLAGLYLTGYFLKNFMHAGAMGDLLSAGTVPLIYTLIGLKVAAEMSGIVFDFMGED